METVVVKVYRVNPDCDIVWVYVGDDDLQDALDDYWNGELK